MDKFETIIVLDINADFEKIKRKLKEFFAERLLVDIYKEDDLGKIKLAYPIKGHNFGNYLVIHYSGDMDVVNKLERELRINNYVLKYITVREE